MQHGGAGDIPVSTTTFFFFLGGLIFLARGLCFRWFVRFKGEKRDIVDDVEVLVGVAMLSYAVVRIVR